MGSVLAVGANDLAFHAKTRKLDYSFAMPASDFVSSALAVLALESARGLGLDVAELARKAGLSLSDLSDPDVSIPFGKFVTLWTAIAQTPGGQTVGLQCIETARLSMVGAVGYAIRNAETVGHALSMVLRHGRVVGEPLLPRIQIGDGRLILSARWTGALAENRPFGESAYGTLIGVIREVTGTQPVPIEIRCQFPRPADADLSARAFGCDASYDCDESMLVFPESLAHEPIPGRDPALFALVDRYAQRLAGAPVEACTLAADVRAVIRAELPSGEPSIARVARKLAMSARTLQRRLASDSLTVSSLVDEARRELARSYLRDPSLGISDIAFMLGYSDATSFQRAFRRWTGEAPAAFRRGRKVAARVDAAGVAQHPSSVTRC